MRVLVTGVTGYIGGRLVPRLLRKGHTVRSLHVAAKPELVFRVFTSLGGEQGWLTWNWAWHLRGMIDRLVGGPGLITDLAGPYVGGSHLPDATPSDTTGCAKVPLGKWDPPGQIRDQGRPDPLNLPRNCVCPVNGYLAFMRFVSVLHGSFVTGNLD